jgi:hypothetical protein
MLATVDNPIFNDVLHRLLGSVDPGPPEMHRLCSDYVRQHNWGYCTMINLQVIPALREENCDQLDVGSVREFPRFGYSMKDVRPRRGGDCRRIAVDRRKPARDSGCLPSRQQLA